MAGGRSTPWWQLTRTSRQGFGLTGLIGLVAVLSWLWPAADGRTFEVVLACFWTVLAVGLLASSLALRRREQG
ncbi:hypothetical protein [Jannaschia sp. R86511]|uniref:hypothetical protein n=1 Tax=Jannaschia sp. R86511 TaxID=3093853 RepID=UPI0036D24AA6